MNSAVRDELNILKVSLADDGSVAAGAVHSGEVVFNGIAAPAVSTAGKGKFYFDSTKLKFVKSENGNAYSPFGLAPYQDPLVVGRMNVGG